MEHFEPKKLLILRILEILTNYSNQDHKLRQTDIIRYLKVIYGIDCERKAVARNLHFLQQAGYDIVSDKTGSYLATRRYEVGELRLLIDAVLSNRNIGKTHTRDLIAKLVKEGGNHFKTHANHVVNLDDWQKENGHNYFFNIEMLCEAIELNKKIKFFYNTYGIDKKLHKKSDTKSIVNPYQLLLKNGKYYLLCNYDKYNNIAFCRIDHITDLEIIADVAKPLKKIKGYEHGINLGKLYNRLPYLFEDEPQTIEFLADNFIINEIIDRFGFDVCISPHSDTQIKVTLTAGPKAMRFWILQYSRNVKVLAPQTLCDIIVQDIKTTVEIYNIKL